MVNVFLVDIEYLQYADLSDPDEQKLVDATIDAQLESLKAQYPANKKNTLVVGTMVWEVNSSSESPIKQNFQYFANRCNDLNANAHLITRLEMQDLVADIKNATCIDFCLLRSVYYASRPGQLLSNKWYPNNKKFLFLMGKSFKPHRIGLLYRFYKQEMLDYDRAIWSYYDKISENECKNYVPVDATFEDIHTLLNSYQRFPDQVSPVNNHYCGFPFDPQLYKKTNLSVVSETTCSGNPWNSEKIYRPILNYHPFIIAGAVRHSEYLQAMGFETFDQYFAVPDYSSIIDLDNRLDAIVDNVKNFDPTSDQIQQIHDATHKNFQKLHKLAKHYIGIIDNMLAMYNISKSWIEILPLQDTDFLSWQYYYQTIKGPSWPPCASIADCVNLPVEIQQELKNKFDVNF